MLKAIFEKKHTDCLCNIRCIMKIYKVYAVFLSVRYIITCDMYISWYNSRYSQSDGGRRFEDGVNSELCTDCFSILSGTAAEMRAGRSRRTPVKLE